MSKLSPKALKFIAIIVSVVLAGLVYSYLSGLQTETKETSGGVQGSVVVATMDISKNAIVKADMVKMISVDAETIQKDVCRDINDVVGKITNDAIYSGDQINKRRLLDDQKMVGFIGAIPEDKRAVAVSINDVTGVAGFLKPGNRVDIMLVTNADKTIKGKLLLQDMLLLAINKSHDVDKKEGGEQMALATFAVSPEEAIRLAVAQKQGELYLSLRPLHPKNRLSIAGEISIYQGGTGNEKARPANAGMPPRRSEPAPNYGLNAPKKQERTRLTVGEHVDVIRGNKVESVTTR